jgi:hypothetical protein
VLRVHKVHKEADLVEHKEHLVLKVFKEQMAPKELQDHKDLLVIKEPLEQEQQVK